MSEMSGSNWSETDASNNASVPDGWPEGQTPGSVNNCARAMMGALKRFWNRANPVYATGGSATAYTLTLTVALAAYVNYERYCVRPNNSNSGADPTININSLGAKTIKKYVAGSKVALASGDFQAGGAHTIWYDGTHFILDNPAPAAAVTAVVPVGGVMPYGGASAPSLWLLCYGQAVSRSTYSALFSAIGTAWGTGDGSTTFNLPDLRGRVPAGKDDMGGSAASRITNSVSGFVGSTLGAAGGAESHTLVTAEMPLHGHPWRADTQSGGSADGSGGFMMNDNTLANQAAYTGTPASTLGQQIGGTGGGGAHRNVQPTAIVNYIIFANA